MNKDLRSYTGEARQISVCPKCRFEHNLFDFMINQKTFGLVLCPGCGNKISYLDPVVKW